MILFIFLNCEIDACICVGFIFLNEKSSEQKDVKKQRIFTIIGWGMVVLFFSLILSVFRSKYHGYPYRSVSFSQLFIFVCVILSCLQFFSIGNALCEFTSTSLRIRKLMLAFLSFLEMQHSIMIHIFKEHKHRFHTKYQMCCILLKFNENLLIPWQFPKNLGKLWEREGKNQIDKATQPKFNPLLSGVVYLYPQETSEKL